MQRSLVVERLRDHGPEIRERFHVSALLLFGSTARGQAEASSDVDLLVEFDRPVGLFHFIDLQQYLERLLGCKVDLGTPRSLKPYLREEVLREAIYVT